MMPVGDNGIKEQWIREPRHPPPSGQWGGEEDCGEGGQPRLTAPSFFPCRNSGPERAELQVSPRQSSRFYEKSPQF